jgi:hypothetical protein
MKAPILVYAVLFSLIFQACIKEEFNPDELSKSTDLNASIAVPIGHTYTTLQEIFATQIESGILTEDEDGLLRFRFSQGLFSVNASDLIQFPDFDSAYALINNTGQALDLNPSGTEIQLNYTYYLDFGYSQGIYNEETDSIFLNNMSMRIDALAPGILNANLDALFPGISYNNLQYSKNLIVSSSNSYSDLMAYTVHLDNSGPDKNRLRIDLTLNLRQTARIIAPGEKIMDVILQFSAIDYQLIYGYIGSINLSSVPIADNTIEILNNQVSGYFNFEYGNFDLITENSLGFPISFNLTDFLFTTYYIPTNSIVYQNNSVPGYSAIVAFPSMDEIGQTIQGEAQINSGQVQLAFQDYYSIVSGTLGGQTNPEGNNDYNFVLKNSSLDVSTGFSLPFWGHTYNFHLTDTINFVLNNFFNSNYPNIDRLLFVLNFTNALPMNSLTQVYFCDAAGILLDSMFTAPHQISGSAQINGNGKVSPEPDSPVKVEILSNRLANIAQTTHLLIKSDIKTIDSDQSPPVSWKFFSDYYFYIQIGVAATLKP